MSLDWRDKIVPRGLDVDSGAWATEAAIGMVIEEAIANTNGGGPAASYSARVVPFSDFIAAEEATKSALLGSDEKKLLTPDSDTVFYGEGGSGKTTLGIDMGCHLAAGVDWLGFAIDKPVTVLLLENEGPRAEYRLKLRRKLETWDGEDFAERIVVWEEPWGRVDLRKPEHVKALAAAISEHEVDVVIAGPIRRLGLEGGGTPAETVAFMELLKPLREKSGRPIAIVLVHHENKGGDISGAFEAEFDTVIHVKADGRDRTQLYFRKSRWSSKIHRSRATLAWIAESEGFVIVATDIDGDRGAAARDAVRDAAEAETLAWIAAYVSNHHASTGTGVPRGKVEEAYHEAHENKGRNRARTVIDREIALAADHLTNGATGETPPVLATGPGKTTLGKYLYPFNQAPSPLAATPNGETGETGETTPRPPAGDATRQFAAALGEGGERRVGGEGALPAEATQ